VERLLQAWESRDREAAAEVASRSAIEFIWGIDPVVYSLRLGAGQADVEQNDVPDPQVLDLPSFNRHPIAHAKDQILLRGQGPTSPMSFVVGGA
jgi:hypothetical protein